MTELELLRLIDPGENIRTEFKRLVHSPEKIAKSLTAFANTEGGTILVGVDDDKRIVGIASEKETTEIIYEAATLFCDPQVPFEVGVAEFRGRDVLIVIVEESDHKPHHHLSETRDQKTFKKQTERKVYVRSGSRNTVASKEVAKLMASERKELRFSYGENEKMLLRYLDAYQRITLHEFSHLVNISHRRASRILIALVRAGVIRIHTEGKNDYYTLAYR
ncbi:MAG: putative DNA binding domain-containing protein [Rhizobacter sp.]|nr:putative DNA binding domain-containing protein [Chlorobiales bacterium]